jgi:UDP-N-acetyl-2-amino-2-deoxyglucuronate dehydrogenase
MSADAPETGKRMRFALVGAGVIGAHHGRVLSELADRIELTAVVDIQLERAKQLAAEHDGQAFSSLSEALAEADIDAVSICTPTGRHGEGAIEALEAGKHVLIEKPAEVTVAKTDEIIAAQRRAGKLVTVISQHRFDPSTEVTVEAIRRGELGRLTTGIASIDWWRGQGYYDSGDWRGTWALDGGGALMNQGVHTVDLLLATMGRPVEVFAYTGTLAHERIEVEDVAVGVVRFESGALGVLHATTSAYPGLSARLQVHGDRGSVVIDNDELSFIHVTRAGSEAEEKSYGSVSTSVNQLADYPEASPAAAAGAGSNPGALSTSSHRRQYENFLAAVEGTEELRVDLETNRQSIAVITGVYESARTGQPVRLKAFGQ